MCEAKYLLITGCGALVLFASHVLIYKQCCVHERHIPEKKAAIASKFGHSDLQANTESDLQKWMNIFWPNDTLENWVDQINGPKHLMPMRPSKNLTWPEVDGTISQSGHKVCAFIRDGWSCTGSQYAKVLRSTQPYQHLPVKYDLLALPPTKIVAVGNSMLAELVGTVICNHKWTAAYVFASRIANSLLAHNADKQITMLLLSNDGYTDGSRDPRSTARLLKEAKFTPDIILLGSYNNAANSWTQVYESPYKQIAENRRKHLVQAFPKAVVVDLPGKHIGDSCPTGGCQCNGLCAKRLANILASKQDFFTAHECIPGPILRYAEELVSVLHLARFDRAKLMNYSCLGIARPRPARSCV